MKRPSSKNLDCQDLGKVDANLIILCETTLADALGQGFYTLLHIGVIWGNLKLL